MVAANPNGMKLMKCGVGSCQVERVENKALEQLFELNKKGITKDPMTLYQRVPAQFCRFISWIGFQREYSPPDGKYAILII